MIKKITQWHFDHKNSLWNRVSG